MISPTSRVRLLLGRPLLALLIVSATGPAAAQRRETPSLDDAQNRAAARLLFEDGLRHADTGRWAEAADRFERAQALRPSAEIAYNLSTALVRLGRLVGASELLRQIPRDPRSSLEVRQAAQARLEQVVPLLARLHIEGYGALSGAIVTVDDKPVGVALLGVDFPVDPGAHTIEARRESVVVARRDVLLQAGGYAKVDLGLPAGAPAPPALAAPQAVLTGRQQATEPRADPPPPLTRRWWFWAALGAVALGGAVATPLLLADPDPVRGNVTTWTLQLGR